MPPHPQDRNRYGTDGVPATILFGGGQRYIVRSKHDGKRNQWAKVRVDEAAAAAGGAREAELVELLGPCGDHPTELLA